ncbi:hypothetical protein [Paraburkholderia heleia]|uniref:hypothetical protein n=1 Tax=Paraburkholderia heleia TaxID=634127 RepID=UPI0031E1614B
MSTLVRRFCAWTKNKAAEDNSFIAQVSRLLVALFDESTTQVAYAPNVRAAVHVDGP